MRIVTTDVNSLVNITVEGLSQVQAKKLKDLAIDLMTADFKTPTSWFGKDPILGCSARLAKEIVQFIRDGGTDLVMDTMYPDTCYTRDVRHVVDITKCDYKQAKKFLSKYFAYNNLVRDERVILFS